MALLKRHAAAELMEHFAAHNESHGYDQGNRWGDGGSERVTLSDGSLVTIATGDRDCSAGLISAFQAVGIDCGGATYTGNMRDCMLRTGNFAERPLSHTAKRGDVYLSHRFHTALCVSEIPDMLAEFAINERGGIVGGRVGDQTGGECRVAAYYSFPWDCILECVNGEAVHSVSTERSVPVQMWDANNTEAQLWAREDADGGWSRLRNVASGLYLDVCWGGSEPGTPVQAYTANGSKAQEWMLEPCGEGFNPQAPMLLIPRCAPHLVLDVVDGSENQGARLQLWERNGTNAQRFSVMDKGSNRMAFIGVGGMKAVDVVNGGR
jgi:hypothetical protein